MYCALMKLPHPLPDWPFFKALSCFRLASIAQVHKCSEQVPIQPRSQALFSFKKKRGPGNEASAHCVHMSLNVGIQYSICFNHLCSSLPHIIANTIKADISYSVYPFSIVILLYMLSYICTCRVCMLVVSKAMLAVPRQSCSRLWWGHWLVWDALSQGKICN